MPAAPYRRGGPAISGWDRQFASLFATPLQCCQSNLGLTYGSVMLASGTSPPAVGISGTTAAAPKPIKVTTSAGALGVATYSLYHDGGTLVVQSGLTAASVAIAALSGMSLTFPSATYAADNAYLATCAGLADQSGNGKNYTQGTASKQPVITVGLGGNVGLLADGIDDLLQSALVLPAQGPGLPVGLFVVCRIMPGTNRALCGDLTGNALHIFVGIGNQIAARVTNTGGYVFSPGSTFANQWVEGEVQSSSQLTDYFKFGTLSATGVAFAPQAGSGGQQIFNHISAFGGQYLNAEVLAIAYLRGYQNWPAIRAAVREMYGNTVVI